MDNRHIQNLRQDYKAATLSLSDVDADPVVQFGHWFTAAEKAGIHEPNAMTLATAGVDGRPSARIVLLKGVDHNGFVFYTNYESRKGQDLSESPFAALVFFWPELERQIRIEGHVKMTSEKQSEAYFRSRPRGSQFGALASPQSRVIGDRAELEESLAELQEELADQEITRPAHWGGYVLEPDYVEFWQGRSNRLHDRIRYRLAGDKWMIERLAP
ncbi:MAG: pyridoxamine 5'-phosphate oxidase [Mucilaginibacter polytrichastri]|nr:pyridoxamine 5'-phosphate oxidase [Mucilaginibacter polytrichastri]